MTVPERRQSPRIKVDGFAYLKIGPSNAGSVVNVSEGGLCFRAIAPVHRNGTVRFSFSEHNHQIEGGAELAWTDGTQKSGGLRFTALPTEAQQQIRHWLDQSGTTLTTAAAGETPVQAQPAVPLNAGRWPEVKPGDTTLLAGATRNRLRGFSGGLATGLIISALISLAILFHSYRRQFGEFLIQLGEGFASRPSVTTAAVPVTQPALPVQAVSQPVSPVQGSSAQAPPVERTAQPSSPPVTSQPLSKAAKPEDVTPEVVTHRAASVPAPAVSPAPPPSSSPAPSLSTQEVATPLVADAPAKTSAIVTPVSLSKTAPALSSDNPGKLPEKAVEASQQPPAVVAAPPPRNAAQAPVADQPRNHVEESKPSTSISTAESFLEVGKFKDAAQARDTTDKLAQLGFPATSVQKGWLWTNAYHVLVGPYEGDQEAKVARKELATKGFTPHSFERGSRDLTLLSNVIVSGTRVPVGDYTIRWESYINDAAVKVERNNSVVSSAEGKWVKRGTRFQRNAYMYRKNGDGSKTLLEIQFGGMNQALVFGHP